MKYFHILITASVGYMILVAAAPVPSLIGIAAKAATLTSPHTPRRPYDEIFGTKQAQSTPPQVSKTPQKTSTPKPDQQGDQARSPLSPEKQNRFEIDNYEENMVVIDQARLRLEEIIKHNGLSANKPQPPPDVQRLPPRSTPEDRENYIDALEGWDLYLRELELLVMKADLDNRRWKLLDVIQHPKTGFAITALPITPRPLQPLYDKIGGTQRDQVSPPQVVQTSQKTATPKPGHEEDQAWSPLSPEKQHRIDNDHHEKTMATFKEEKLKLERTIEAYELSAKLPGYPLDVPSLPLGATYDDRVHYAIACETWDLYLGQLKLLVMEGELNHRRSKLQEKRSAKRVFRERQAKLQMLMGHNQT